MILLPDGRNVNICTNEGASAFFGYNPQFVTTWTEQASEILASNAGRSRGRRPGFSNLVVLYQMLGVMAESLRPEQLGTLHRDQFQRFVDFLKMRFTEVSSTSAWRASGKLSQADQELLDAVVPWLKHPKFVELMLGSRGGFTTIATLVARDDQGKPAMPDAEVTETILMITNNAVLTLNGKNIVDITIERDDMLKYLERTGLLAQALRALTAPVKHGSIQEYLQILDMVEKDAPLLKAKFIPGTATGDILDGLLSGKDGWKPARNSADYNRVMKRLKALKDLTAMAKESFAAEGNKDYGRLCRNCSKSGYDLKESGKRLLSCGKCKNTYYCSRECQVQDWKDHKKTCTPYSNKQPERNIIMSFIKRNYIEVMTKIQETCADKGLDKKNVFLEIDFNKDMHEDSSPAMAGKFRVEAVSECLEGNRSAEPDWFYKGTDVYESNVAVFRVGLQDHCKRMTENHVLVVYRGTSGHAGVYRVDMMSEKTGFHIMSDEALKLFPLDTIEKKMKLQMLQYGGDPMSGVGSNNDMNAFMDMFRGRMGM